jgi:hypothetical protein
MHLFIEIAAVLGWGMFEDGLEVIDQLFVDGLQLAAELALAKDRAHLLNYLIPQMLVQGGISSMA